MDRQLIKLSKYLSYVLRHHPESVGLELEEGGWVPVDALRDACRRDGHPISLAQLRHVVATNDKRRFSFDATGRRIRANQGHSVEVDLELDPLEPPELLFHGTVDRFLGSIRGEGLRRGSRHHVHLSGDEPTARRVGSRRGRPVVLVVEAGRILCDGHTFYQSENGVWLTDAVPPEYLRMP